MDSPKIYVSVCERADVHYKIDSTILQQPALQRFNASSTEQWQINRLNVPNLAPSMSWINKAAKLHSTRKRSSRRRRILRKRELSRMIIPKNALSTLSEFHGITIDEFTVTSDPNCDAGFVAAITINGSQYQGNGRTKSAAKKIACEKALRDYCLRKMRKRFHDIGATSLSLLGRTTNNAKNENSGIADDEGFTISLASFALHKLYAEWEDEGFSVQHLLRRNTDNSAKKEKLEHTRYELPKSWENMHPASFLSEIRPGTTYVDKGKIGDDQYMGVVVDGREFVQFGRSKKEGRRKAAAAACDYLFGTEFTNISK
uniref:DRBM domain-containing protein n=1 Tax=Glossina austeni TaxID=7395 RepID=A0A1A9UMX2_GLOAU